MYPAPTEPHADCLSCARVTAQKKKAGPTKNTTNLNFIKSPSDGVFLGEPARSACRTTTKTHEEARFLHRWAGAEARGSNGPVSGQIPRARQNSSASYPRITSSFSEGIFVSCSRSRFTWAVTASGGKRLSH